jgi:hypothetical protein
LRKKIGLKTKEFENIFCQFKNEFQLFPQQMKTKKFKFLRKNNFLYPTELTASD